MVAHVVCNRKSRCRLVVIMPPPHTLYSKTKAERPGGTDFFKNVQWNKIIRGPLAFTDILGFNNTQAMLRAQELL